MKFSISSQSKNLQSLLKEHKKYPTHHDFPTITRMRRNRRWKRWGITSWEDLMRVVSGKGKVSDGSRANKKTEGKNAELDVLFQK